jgi:hypothetical protein
MTIHEVRTDLPPAEVLERAGAFFALAGDLCAASPETTGTGFLRLHIEVGEILIAAARAGGATHVRGSASRGAHLLTRFLTTLGPPLEVRQTIHRRGLHETRGARTEPFAGSRNAVVEPEPARAPRAA